MRTDITISNSEQFARAINSIATPAHRAADQSERRGFAAALIDRFGDGRLPLAQNLDVLAISRSRIVFRFEPSSARKRWRHQQPDVARPWNGNATPKLFVRSGIGPQATAPG